MAALHLRTAFELFQSSTQTECIAAASGLAPPNSTVVRVVLLSTNLIFSSYAPRVCCRISGTLCLWGFLISGAMDGQANDSLHFMDDDVDSSLVNSCRLYSFIVHTLIMGTLVVVGIIGNSLTFVVFWKGNFKSSTSFLFLSLALIDSALLLIVFTLFTLAEFDKYTGLLQSFSNIYPYLIVYVFPSAFLAKTATIWVVVLIAVNRYIIVCLPLRASQWCTLSKMKIQLALVLAGAVLYNIPKFVERHIVYGTIHTSNNGTSNTAYEVYTRFGENRSFYRVYDTVFLLIFLLVLPILILTVITIRLIKAMKAHRRMQLEMQSRSQTDDSNVTSSLVFVVIVFIACQVPTFVCYALWEVLPSDTRSCGGIVYYLGEMSNLLVTLNSAVNFFIYIVTNRRFRDVLLKHVCRRREQSQVSTDNRRFEGQRQSFQLQ